MAQLTLRDGHECVDLVMGTHIPKEDLVFPQPLSGQFLGLTRIPVDAADGTMTYPVLCKITPQAMLRRLRDYIDPKTLTVYEVRRRALNGKLPFTLDEISSCCVLTFDYLGIAVGDRGVTMTDLGLLYVNRSGSSIMTGLFAYADPDGSVIIQHST